jgi:hypothetical protein
MNEPKSKAMSKPKASHLPDWANEPLTFAVNPDEALKRGAFAKPPKVQDLKKSIRLKSKSRR